MTGFILWCVLGALFICLGIYSYFSSRTVGFWANIKLFEVTDIKKYNTAIAKLFCGFGFVFILLGLPLLPGQGPSGIIPSIIGVILETIAALAAYAIIIERKYKRKIHIHPYKYNGKMTTKQDKCKSSMPLDKPRVWVDFNELCADDNIYLFSQADIVNDSEGNDVELYEGMKISVFDNDLNEWNKPDAILAEGIIIKNVFKTHPQVKWLLKLTKSSVDSGCKYVYWMSDIQ